MLDQYINHNRFQESLSTFVKMDPHLRALSKLRYQYTADWWQDLDIAMPGIYILTGGRQVGKSTSCKLLIKHCLQNKMIVSENVFYLPCDEIFDASHLARILRNFLDQALPNQFLLIIDEITFVKNWDRIIKALADEGYFTKGICLLTGSDTL